MRQLSLPVRKPPNRLRIATPPIRSKRKPSDPVVLLMTRDQALIESTTRSCLRESLSLECIAGYSVSPEQLNGPQAVQALVADLGDLDKDELAGLQVLIGAAPNLPVIFLCKDDAAYLQNADLLAQGAQDLLIKSLLRGRGFGRAVGNAITRKAREVALTGGNERARMTLQSIGDAVLSTDSSWLVTFVNPIAERLLGCASAEAVGRHVSDVFEVLDGASRERLAPLMERAIQAGSTVMLPPNCVLVRRNGEEMHIEDSAAPIYDIHGNFAGMVVVFHDISEARAITQKMSHGRTRCADVTA